MPGTTQPSLTSGIEVGVARAAVRVDHQARDVVEDRRRVEPPGQAPGEVGGADVPADMAGQRLLADARAWPIAPGTLPAGMVAEEEHRGPPGRVEQLESGGLGDGSVCMGAHYATKPAAEKPGRARLRCRHGGSRFHL